MIRHTARILLSALFIAFISALIIAFVASYFYWQQLIPWAAERWLQEHNWQITEIKGAAPGTTGWQIDALSLQQISPSDTNTRIQIHQLNIDWNLPRLFTEGKLEQISLQSADIQLPATSSDATTQVDLSPWLSPAIISQIPANSIQLTNVSIQRSQPEFTSRVLNNLRFSDGHLSWSSNITSLPGYPGFEGLKAELKTHLSQQTDSSEASILLSPFNLKIQFQNQLLLSSQGSLQLGTKIQLNAEHQLQLENIEAFLSPLLLKHSAEQFLPEEILPMLKGTLIITGQTRLQPQYNPSLPLQSLQPESKQQISLSIPPASLTPLSLKDISGTAALELNASATLTPDKLHITMTDNNQFTVSDLRSPSLQSKSVRLTLSEPVDIELPLTDLTQLNIPKTTFTLHSQNNKIISQSTALEMSHQPILLTTNEFKLCITAPCSSDLLNISGTLNSADIRVTHPDFSLPMANLNSRWQLQQQASALDLKQQFNVTLFDILLPASQQRIRGNSRTLAETGKQPLMTANWQTKLPSLTGIETLIKRYYPTMPDELTFSDGELSHQGALHFENNRLALRLRQRIEGLNGQYQQNSWIGLNWHSDLRRSLRGKLRDDGSLSVDFIAAGIPIEQFSSDYQLRPEKGNSKRLQLRLTKPRAQLLGGEVIADDFTVGESFELNTRLTLNNIQLKDVLALEQQEGLSGEGILQGSIPLEKNTAGFQVNDGQIRNIDTGWIKFLPTPELTSLANTTPGLGTAFKALENLQYSQLNIDMNYQPDGSTRLNTRLQGMNPDWNAGQKVDLSINIEENLLQLIKALQYTNKLTRSLEKRYR